MFLQMSDNSPKYRMWRCFTLVHRRALSHWWRLSWTWWAWEWKTWAIVIGKWSEWRRKKTVTANVLKFFYFNVWTSRHLTGVCGRAVWIGLTKTTRCVALRLTSEGFENYCYKHIRTQFRRRTTHVKRRLLAGGS